ncbi:sigma factor [Zobellia uliginosa]|uniref:sigma factor n=1 Tax=Zobellia uliginosa TaxID=143224 RepID=UPI001C066BCF|nr:sigma factor [Zobellia uliginosa]MBU2948421.1 hypothetical protein [Zobellia uliginosa]
MNLILEEIRKKNEKVFKNFFDKHYEEFVVYANGYLFDKDSSEDIVQEIFIYIWEHANTLKIETSLKGYIYAMVRNKCFNYLKSIKITDNLELLDFNINLIAEHVFNLNYVIVKSVLKSIFLRLDFILDSIEFQYLIFLSERLFPLSNKG